MEVNPSYTSLVILSMLLVTLPLALSLPTSNTMNSQPLQSNQLTGGEGGLQGQGFRELPNLKSGDQQQQQQLQQQTVGQYIYRSNPTNTATQTYVQSYNPNGAYAREATQTTSPFFGLSSNGEFQLSAYFSQIFWGFVALVVGTALIIWLIRIFFPKESLGGIVAKIKDSGTARSIDLDRLTNIVYGALDTYGKWAAKDVRDSVQHGKSR